MRRKKKPTRASKTVPSFIRDSGRHVFNDLISRLSKNEGLLCLLFREKKELISFHRKSSFLEKKTKISLLCFLLHFQTLLQISAFNRDEEGGDEEQREQTRKNNNNNNEDVGNREGVLPL